MKKTIKLFLIMTLAFSSLKANATVLTDAQVKAMVAQQVVENYKKYTDAEIKAEVVALAFRELDLPAGKISFVVKPSVDKFMARDLEKVFVYVNDKLIKTFNAPVIVKAYQNVLVASGCVNREQLISPRIVKVEKKEISNNFGFWLRADEINKNIVTKKMFIEGEVIDRRFVKLKPDILRNSIVTVSFNTSNLTVTVDGTALTDGNVGDNICIMNKNYNRIYKGTIVGENRVLVKL